MTTDPQKQTDDFDPSLGWLMLDVDHQSPPANTTGQPDHDVHIIIGTAGGLLDPAAATPAPPNGRIDYGHPRRSPENSVPIDPPGIPVVNAEVVNFPPAWRGDPDQAPRQFNGHGQPGPSAPARSNGAPPAYPGYPAQQYGYPPLPPARRHIAPPLHQAPPPVQPLPYVPDDVTGPIPRIAPPAPTPTSRRRPAPPRDEESLSEELLSPNGNPDDHTDDENDRYEQEPEDDRPPLMYVIKAALKHPLKVMNSTASKRPKPIFPKGFGLIAALLIALVIVAFTLHFAAGMFAVIILIASAAHFMPRNYTGPMPKKSDPDDDTDEKE